jgi:HEPN domain-containing protein
MERSDAWMGEAKGDLEHAKSDMEHGFHPKLCITVGNSLARIWQVLQEVLG